MYIYIYSKTWHKTRIGTSEGGGVMRWIRAKCNIDTHIHTYEDITMNPISFNHKLSERAFIRI